MKNTNFKALPIILDRLAHALSAQGIKVKRSQLLEISATAFGHRNSNELTAAAKAGEINPYPAKVIGRVNLPDGQSLIVVNDQHAEAPYAIDESFLDQVAAEERREEIGITPYGHLTALCDVLDAVDIPDIVNMANNNAIVDSVMGKILPKIVEALDSYTASDEDVNEIGQAELAITRAIEAQSTNPAKSLKEVASAKELIENINDDAGNNLGYALKLIENIQEAHSREPGTIISNVHVGIVSHKEGKNVYVAVDYDGLTMQVAEYVRENWDDEVGDYADEYENPETMTDTEVVEAYFELSLNHGIDEYFDTSIEEITARIIPVPQEAPVTPGRYGLQCEMDDEPIFIIDRHVKNDDNEYATVAEMPRTNNPQADIDLAQKIIKGLNGDSVPKIAPGHILTADLHALSDNLISGAEEDLWYDAHDYMDESDPRDPDTIKWKRICDVQMAMTRTASILKNIASGRLTDRQVSTHTASPEPVVRKKIIIDDILERQAIEPVWITDADGYDTMQVNAEHMKALGLGFSTQKDDALPLTEDEYAVLLGREMLNKESAYMVECGFSVLYKGKKWLAPEIAFNFDPDSNASRDGALAKAKAWIEEKREEIERVGGHIILNDDACDNEHELTVLLPFSLALESQEIDDWRDALAWLMRPEADRAGPRVKCDFLAQTWVKDWAMAVDPHGDTAWDATFDAVRWGQANAQKMLESDMDQFAIEGACAPEWIQQWTKSNPFDVEVFGLEELFGLDE